jgi:hypothetical protein
MTCSRRDFLKAGAAFGGVSAVASLPAVADDPSLFPRRGRFERLSLACHHITAGASRPFSVLHLSDTHLTAADPHESEWTRSHLKRRTQTFGGRQEEALRDSLAWAKSHVDFVVHTGDLIDAQSEANFRLVRKYFGTATGAAVPGNHEYFYGYTRTPEADRAARAKVAAAFPADTSLSSTVVCGVNFVTLDNGSGPVTAAQATRFEAEVKKGLPVILCLHCPFPTPHISRAAAKFWAKKNLKAVPPLRPVPSDTRRRTTTSDFIAFLKAQPLLKGILAGHLHIDVQDRFSPTAMEYVVGGNFLFHGAEITFS